MHKRGQCQVCKQDREGRKTCRKVGQGRKTCRKVGQSRKTCRQADGQACRAGEFKQGGQRWHGQAGR
jgi:hypothetical protein